MRSPRHGSLARRLRRPLAASLVVLLLGACAFSDADVAERRTEIASDAATAVHAELEALLSRLRDAVQRADTALDETDGTREARFGALERVQREAGVHGLAWEGPGGTAVWCGRTVDTPAPPHAPAWEGTFRRGSLTYHAGPYVNALVLGPVAVGGGYLVVTGILEERAPRSADPPFTELWLEPLGAKRVAIRPPDAVREPDEDTATFLIFDEGEPVLRGEVDPPGEVAVRDRLEQRRRTRVGVLLFGLWLLGLAVGIRLLGTRIRPGALRWLSAALLVIVARTVLGALDPAGRFPFLRPGFDPTDFGVQDPLAWLASPSDFALTSLTFVLAAAFLSMAARAVERPGSAVFRILAVVGGIGMTAATAALWIGVVDVAVTQSQTRYFQALSIVPPIPAALMLLGLVATTAAAWLLAAVGLRVARAALPTRPRYVGVPLVVVAAVGLAAWLAGPGTPLWASLLLPVAATVVLLARPEDGEAELPGTVLLVGVLATVLLFPMLWLRVGERRTEALSAALEDLLRREATTESDVRYALTAVASDPRVRGILEEARDGPRPEGLALSVWKDSFLSEAGEHGIVTILGPGGRRLDDFTLTPLPASSVPAPAPPAAGKHDFEVGPVPEDTGRLRTVVGRVRLRTRARADDEDGPGASLGSVVMTVPQRLDLAFLGLDVLGDYAEDRLGTALRPYRLQFAILRSGWVVRSSDSSVSRRPGSFGPAELEDVGPSAPTLTWKRDGKEGYAVWSPERSAVVAVRRRLLGGAEAVLALARLTTVGVGMAGFIALLVLLIRLPRLRARLQNRILVSYFAISVVPLLLLGLASAREVRVRHDENLSERLETDIGRARSDLEAQGAEVFDRASDENLVLWAHQRGHDALLYRDGEVFSASRSGLVEAELIPRRLPPAAYVATQLDRRELVLRQAAFAGLPVWIGYAPVLDGGGRPVATVGVPLLYDRARVEEELAVTGSVLVAAYLLTLVLVLVGGIWAARRLARPLGLLAAGTRRVTAGELDVELAPAGTDELGELVQAFNQMTRELKEATDRAVRAERDEAWRRMARQVAHEIKNPLTPMRLMLQQMEVEAERHPDQAIDIIGRTAPVVLRQIEALGRIASDFAHFARMPRRVLQEVDVPSLARDVVELHRGTTAEGVSVELELELAGELPPVRWDAQELRRVLLNVVGNAVQSIEGSGRVIVRVAPRTSGARNGVEVEVEDDGIGIPPENLDSIFEPDFSTRTDGTGLGLAMVRRTIDDLDGQVTVESEEGRGTLLRLWLPAATEG